MNLSNLTMLLVFSVLYIFGLIVLYFSKERMNNFENKIYKFLIITNFFGLILQLLYDLVLYKNSYIPMQINKTIYKMYLIYFIIWMNLILVYLIGISIKKNRLIIKIVLILTFIESIIVFILPYKLFNSEVNKTIYTYGLAINFIFAVYIFVCSLIILVLIVNRKKITKKKLLPIYLFLLFYIISIIVKCVTPELNILTVLESFICCLMYFTIANPDVKMLHELSLAKELVEKSNRAKSDFLSSMSHEIRTPLNAVVGFSQLIEDADNLFEAKENAKDIISASNTLLEIVNGILDMSKIEANKVEVVEGNYELLPILDDLAKIINTRIGDKSIKLITNFAVDIPKTLYGDKAKIKQIIINLLTNAVKYTKYGTINFKVNCINNLNECKLSIVVSDTGRGIKKEQMDKLFTKFERLDTDRNTTIEGVGLGLAITKSLVEMMNGKIFVQSSYGEGSTFTVYLRQKIVTEDTQKEVIIEKQESFDTKRVLIVDDNNINLKVIDKILKTYNINTTLVNSGIECINRINNCENYDLIFMDIMMPHMGGVETLKTINKLDNFNTPIIALTADAIEGKRDKYIEVGFNDYLSKPIDKNKLKNILNKYLK